jgi:hypothetical protein
MPWAMAQNLALWVAGNDLLECYGLQPRIWLSTLGHCTDFWFSAMSHRVEPASKRIPYRSIGKVQWWAKLQLFRYKVT